MITSSFAYQYKRLVSLFNKEKPLMKTYGTSYMLVVDPDLNDNSIYSAVRYIKDLF